VLRQNAEFMAAQTRELSQLLQAGADRSVIAERLAALVADSDARMAALGVRFRSEPVAIEAGINRGGFTCYFLDPDDITLEIIQAPPARNS
jgi:catechol 2,3-dioxygenase-like lactoylglutathione lyase family enzyme